MPPVVSCVGLTKVYPKGARGVDDLTFEVQRGEVFGFLGPNGAGKTTTIRLLLDLLRPTSGRASVLGLDAREGRREIHARTGYLPGEFAFRDRRSARGYLAFLGELRGGVPRERVDALAARLQLDLDRPLRTLSRGNRQKVGLVAACMHEPELLILDEPTTGLDPLMQREFHALVREARAAGRTVFLSSHVLPEVEALCDRVGIVREGRLAVVASMDDVKARVVRRVTATFRGAAPRTLLDGVKGVSDVRGEGETLSFRVEGPMGDVVQALARADVADVHVREPTLEEAFIAMYEGARA